MQDLHAFAKLDARLRAMRARLDASHSRLEAQEAKAEQFRCQDAELHEQVTQARVRVRTLETTAQQIDERITLLRERMNVAQNHKEYQAMTVEIGTLKADKGRVDDKSLELMETVETLRQQEVQLKEQIAQQSKLTAGAHEDVEAARQELGGKLEKLTLERNQASEKIPEDLLRIFTRLADQYDGETVASLEVQDLKRHEYICGGCYMNVPLQIANRLLQQPDELTTCSSCDRWLVIPDELRTQIVGKN